MVCLWILDFSAGTEDFTRPKFDSDRRIRAVQYLPTFKNATETERARPSLVGRALFLEGNLTDY